MNPDHLDTRGVPPFARSAFVEEYGSPRRYAAPAEPARQGHSSGRKRPVEPLVIAGVPAGTWLTLCAAVFALSLLAGCENPLPRSAAAPGIVPGAVLFSRLDAIADRVDALEANRSLPAEIASACPYGLESLRTFGAEVAGRCRWPKARAPHRRNHR